MSTGAPAAAPRTSRACPSCGHEPRTREEATAQRADLALIWLSADPDRPGQLLPQQHCRRCQPHGPVVDAGTPPKPVHQWLAAEGWQLTPDLLCPDHIRPAHLSS